MNSVLPKRKSAKFFSPPKSPKKPAPSQGRCLDGVFLGGACNPTTWRKDIAVPFLDENRIPYFNPQVDEWRPELISQEEEAKERSSCLLFVFLPHLTRGLSSLVEVANLAARLHSSNRSHVHPHLDHPRSLLVVRPKPSPPLPGGKGAAIFTANDLEKKCATLAELESIEAGYQWLEGLRSTHVRFFDQLEDALLHIKALYDRHYCPDRSIGDPHFHNRTMTVPRKRLLASYQYFPVAEATVNSTIDLYYGGAPPKCTQTNADWESDCVSDGINVAATKTPIKKWVVCRQGAQRDFDVSMAVQRHCPRFYFYISRQGLWIVEQMEAAFAIGSGKEVILCVEYLNNDEVDTNESVESDTSSANSSGYSSLASTPDEVFHPPSGTDTSSSSLDSPPPPPKCSDSTKNIRTRSTIETMCETPKNEKQQKINVSNVDSEKLLGILSKKGGTRRNAVSSPPPFVNGVRNGGEVFGLPVAAVKDHNRSRSYLKSLLERPKRRGGSSEDVGEEDRRGLLLARPAENINDLFLLF